MAQANSGDFRSPRCRLSFSQALWAPRSLDGVKEQYGATFIFEKADLKRDNTLQEKIDKVVEIKWGPKGLSDLRKGIIKSPILDGGGPQAKSKQTGELWAGMGPDKVFIRANANKDAPPLVLWRSKLIPATPEEVYSGCYGNAFLNAYTWEHPSNGRGVSFSLRGFQKTHEGESLGGRAPLNVDKFFVDIPDDVPAPGSDEDVFS